MRAALAALTLTATMHAEMAKEISQYGITWTFDAPAEVGQYISGDYWVVGPVTVTSVSPEPGPSTSDVATTGKSIYGAAALQDDRSLRNGSQLNPGKIGNLSKTGLDSRSKAYDASLSVKYPLDLKPGDRLISSISSESYGPDGKLATPEIIGQLGDIYNKPKGQLALETAALLTVVAEAPADDAFRPAYTGNNDMYYAKDIQWDKLPNLKAPASMPDWEKFERIHERVWFEIPNNWTIQFFGPGLNGPGYGREVNRMSNIASLMLMTDAPREKKEKLLIEYLQWGIDLRGTLDAGHDFFPDGGWWQGRKWPMMFASIMLDAPKLQDWPAYKGQQLRPSAACPNPTTPFQEDLDTYYGKGAKGQDVLWQMNWHTGPKPPYQEKPESEWTKDDKRSDSYCLLNSTTYVGTALAALLMEAKADWNHDAYFDYVDYWMDPKSDIKMPSWLPKGCERTADLFVEDMWRMHRANVPEQPGGKDNWKFVWVDMNKRIGEWVENPKP